MFKKLILALLLWGICVHPVGAEIFPVTDFNIGPLKWNMSETEFLTLVKERGWLMLKQPDSPVVDPNAEGHIYKLPNNTIRIGGIELDGLDVAFQIKKKEGTNHLCMIGATKAVRLPIPDPGLPIITFNNWVKNFYSVFGKPVPGFTCNSDEGSVRWNIKGDLVVLSYTVSPQHDKQLMSVIFMKEQNPDLQ